MAKAPVSDSIQTTDKMKPLLALSKKEPVQAAIGLTSDGDGLILLDKKAKPKKVMSMLKQAAGKAKMNLNSSSLRFGRAEVDTDYDPGCIRFFVNKEAPGMMRVKLIEVAKRIPYQKVELNVDPTLENEPEEEVEGQEANPAQNGAQQPDAGALKQRLTGLVQRIGSVIGTSPNLRAELLNLAKQGQTTLAALDLTAALAAIEQLQSALDGATAQGKTTGATGSTTQYAKARLAWLAVRKQMVADLDKLRDAMLQHYQDANIAGDLNRSYSQKVEPILSVLDEALADALDDATNAGDAQKRSEAVTQAKELIQSYQNFLGSESIIKDIDSNPFVPLQISATLTKTLTTLSAAVN
jgi:hypothetical protein